MMFLKTLWNSEKTRLKKNNTMTPEEKQIAYRDARFLKKYDGIWQSVDKCVFCDLKQKYIVVEENGVVLTVQLFAYTDGHCMIIPKRHITSMKELSTTEWETVRKFSYIAKKIIKDVHGAKGMQFLQKDGSAAQSTVSHLHFHCIPFDDPALSIWNYRKLTYTPLENARLYQNQSAKIQKLAKRFSKKYQSEAE